ncbi:MAG: hypothetical protein GY832_42715 [Chloroflexi bacterium]|nr:hypothetical protein [Chloroflexota bacterium]
MAKKAKEVIKPKTVEEAIKQLTQQFGEGVVIKLNDKPKRKVQSIPTGSLLIDRALGGGIPLGRVTEAYGPEGCLTRDAFVNYEVRAQNGKRQNHKGGTIERLFQRYHKIKTPGSGRYQRESTINSAFYVPAINEEGRVVQTPISNVVYSGLKPCYQLTTHSGRVVTATQDHKFYTDDGYVPLGLLSPDTDIFIHNRTPYTKSKRKVIRYKEIFVKYHPTKRWKVVSGRYRYCRLKRAKAVMEAALNGLRYDEYRNILNTADPREIDKLWIVPDDMDVHHVDENFQNDSLENLMLVNKQQHYRNHAIKNHNNLRFTVMPDPIQNIKYVGTQETFDIQCVSPYNNYIANGVAVHNSGKTTLGLHIVAEAQKQFPNAPAIFIDMEHGLDVDYAEAIGVDTNELLLSQPQSGTAALTIVKKMIGLASIIVVDSVPALVTQAELDAEPGASHVGILPRLMSQHLKEIVPSLGLSNTALVFINQLRMKIGVMFGNPEVSPGGRALKFYASVRMEVRRKGFIGPKDGRTGQAISVKAVKNKVAPPFRVAETNIIFGQGLSRHTDVLALASEHEIVRKSGSHYYYNDEHVANGQKAGEDWVAKHPEIEKAVRKKLFDDTDEPEPEPEPVKDEPEPTPEQATEALEFFNALAE